MAPQEQVIYAGADAHLTEKGIAELDAHPDVAVTRTSTGVEALDRLESAEPACLVVDASLPDVDAPALLDAIRELSPDLPVVVLSETADPALADAVFDREDADFVHWRADAHRPRALVRRVESAVDRRRAERAADRTTARFDARVVRALDALPDLFFTLDTAGNLIQWNEKANAVTGYRDDEIEGRSATEFFSDEDADRVVEALATVRTEGTARVEADLLTKDGREIPYEFTAALLETDDGRTLGIAGTGRDVTDRERREAELVASREKYRKLVETGPDAIFVVDVETGTVVDTNDTAARLLDKSREEILGMNQTELHPADETDRYRRVFEDHVRRGGAVEDTGDYAVVTDDGEEIPVEITASVTEHGGRRLVQAVFRDITERKQRRETLETLREVTRDLMTAETKQEVCDIAVATAEDILGLPVTAVFLLDPDEPELRAVSTTETALELFDRVPSFGEGEGIAWRVFERGTAELYDGVRDHEHVYNPETAIRTEMILPLGDHGILMSGSTTSESIAESEFDLAKILAANIHAALDRADREQTIERQRDELEAELDEVFERIDDAFFALDDEWQFVYLNDRAERLLGVTDAEAYGQLVRNVFPEGRDVDGYEAFRRAVETQEPVTYEAYFEPFEAWFEVHAYPSESGLSVYFRDVTDRKRREQRLERQNDRLDKFASMLAHELRNPLSIAQIYLQTAAAGEESAFDEVTAALDRMEEMIDVLLVMTRGGDSNVDPEPVDLAAAAAEAWSNVDAPTADLEIEAERVVHAEPSHLQNLLENLFRNAVEHGSTNSPPSADETDGGVTVRVGPLRAAADADESASALRTNGGPEAGGDPAPTERSDAGDDPRSTGGFYVEDDGPGVPEHRREAVFEAGHTTDENGIGLGLTFVAQLAEAYGWDCTLTESAAGGARFEFSNVRVGPAD